jgi:cellulose synthase/poly-beta-1,6-N-acetylglucosamine synthase-like glycosyltransferase
LSWLWWTGYATATLGLVLFGAHAFVLLWWRRVRGPAYLVTVRRARERSPLGRTEFPDVLVQLPVFNEPAVAERAVRAAAGLDWPQDRLEVQVLDDSTDETSATVDRVARRLNATGARVRVLRRDSREGFKAGALAAGMRVSSAPFVAVFDADFVPPADFLRRALPLFQTEDARGRRVGCVQGRWEHLNRDANLLTRAQAVSVDAHFFVQQLARAAGPGLLNFNGTAGVWRRAAVEDAGGWSGDTLTEDLDLSYRAQLRGWRLVFDPELAVPAELPPTLSAYKSQQSRWACGSVQCARRFLVPVWRSPLPLAAKVEAVFHLCGYGVCVAMAALTLLLPLGVGHLPMTLAHPLLWPLWAAVWLAALGPLGVSLAGQRAAGRGQRLPGALSAMLLGLGTAGNNAVAVLRGLSLPIRTFVRTPKHGDGRAAPLVARAPRTELVLAALTAVSAAVLAVHAPAAVATYAAFCFSGVWALCAYWWTAERRAVAV